MAMIEQVVPDFDPSWLTDDDSSWLRTIARLAPGVSIAEADAAVRGFTWVGGARAIGNRAGEPRCASRRSPAVSFRASGKKSARCSDSS